MSTLSFNNMKQTNEIWIEVEKREGLPLQRKRAPRYRYIAFYVTGGILVSKNYQCNTWRESINFIDHVIHASPSRLITIVTDHGSEFISSKFAMYLRKKGIYHRRQPPSWPLASRIERVLHSIRSRGQTIVRSRFSIHS